MVLDQVTSRWTMGFSNCKQNMRGQTSARSFWRPCSCRSTIDASSARSSWFLTLSFCNGSHSQVPNLQTRATDINGKTFCSNMYGSDHLKHGILSKEVETHTLDVAVSTSDASVNGIVTLRDCAISSRSRTIVHTQLSLTQKQL